MAFYQRDPNKAPEWLKAKIAHNQEQRKAIAQTLQDKEAEKLRVGTQFDEEQTTLRRLWVHKPNGL